MTGPRLLSGDEVDALATGDLGLAAARRTAALQDVVTGRLQIGDPVIWMRVLGGIVPELDLLGYKEFHRTGKDVYYHVHLFRRSTGEPLGIVDARRLTSLRTASTAAIPFVHLFGSRPMVLGIVGSGEEAREGLRAVAAAANVTGAQVFSPTPANRDAFARELGGELGISIDAVDSVTAAFDGADAGYIATAATAPVVSAADVAALELVAAVGATRPDHHELSGDVVARARSVVVDCADALTEPGDMIDAVDNYGWNSGDAMLLAAWLGTPALEGEAPVLFKSIGSVEQDLVLAYELLMAADAADHGRKVEPIATLRVMR